MKTAIDPYEGGFLSGRGQDRVESKFATEINCFGDSCEERVSAAIDGTTGERSGEDFPANSFAGFKDNDVEIGSLCRKRECRGESGDARTNNNDTPTFTH